MQLAKLTHWGRVTHICVGKLTIIGSDNGLSPDRRQAIIITNVGILLIGTLGTNFSEILSEIHTFSFKEMHLKISSGRWQPFCLGLNVLTCDGASDDHNDSQVQDCSISIANALEIPQLMHCYAIKKMVWCGAKPSTSEMLSGIEWPSQGPPLSKNPL